jgi:hypothetical protein
MKQHSDNTTRSRAPKFEPGQVYSTPGAIAQLHPEDMHIAFCRHLAGDWGDVCPEDQAENERALREGGRLFSAYIDRSGTKFWIITEADRSATTILLPSEY